MKTKRSFKIHTVSGKTAPQRTCIGCRRIRDKREMVRLVRTRGGAVEIDTMGKKEGRGAYICPDRSCWEKALNGTQLERTLRSSLTTDNRKQLLQDKEGLLEGVD